MHMFCVFLCNKVFVCLNSQDTKNTQAAGDALCWMLLVRTHVALCITHKNISIVDCSFIDEDKSMIASASMEKTKIS